MARRNTKAKPAQSLSQRSSLMAGMLQSAAQKKFGDEVSDFGKFLNSVYGVPLPGMLPLQYLLGVDVLPLGRVMTIVGPSASTKSSMGWYLMHHIMAYSGLGIFCDAEQKTNPDQVRALFSNDTLMNMVQYDSVQTVEKLEERFLYYVRQYMELVPENDIPWMLLLDSLNAVTTEEAKTKVESQDELGYSNARRASRIQTLLQVMIPNYLAKIPGILIMINHQTPSMANEGVYSMSRGPKFSEAGGTFKEFAYTYKMEMRKAGKITRRGGDIPLVQITFGKSSLGPARNIPIVVPYRSHFDDDGLEHIYYDWDHALTLLLTHDKSPKTELKEVISISGAGEKWNCSTLGLKDVSRSELGKAIHENAELVKALQKVLKIRNKPYAGELAHPAGYVSKPVPEGSREAEEGRQEEEGSDA